MKNNKKESLAYLKCNKRSLRRYLKNIKKKDRIENFGQVIKEVTSKYQWIIGNDTSTYNNWYNY